MQALLMVLLVMPAPDYSLELAGGISVRGTLVSWRMEVAGYVTEPTSEREPGKRTVANWVRG